MQLGHSGSIPRARTLRRPHPRRLNERRAFDACSNSGRYRTKPSNSHTDETAPRTKHGTCNRYLALLRDVSLSRAQSIHAHTSANLPVVSTCYKLPLRPATLWVNFALVLSSNGFESRGPPGLVGARTWAPLVGQAGRLGSEGQRGLV